MKTRLKARKEEKAPSIPLPHGLCKVHVELDRSSVFKKLEAVVPEAELPSQLESHASPPKVEDRLPANGKDPEQPKGLPVSTATRLSDNAIHSHSLSDQKKFESRTNMETRKSTRLNTRAKRPPSGPLPEDFAIKGLSKLVQRLWDERKDKAEEVQEKSEDKSSKQVKRKAKAVGKKKPVKAPLTEPKKEEPPQPEESKYIPINHQVAKEEVFIPENPQFIEEKLVPSVSASLLSKGRPQYPSHGYGPLPPSMNTALYNSFLLDPNNPLNYMLYNSQCLTKPATDPYSSPRFPRPAPEAVRPIFRRCSQHIAIAYHIQASKKRAVENVNKKPLTMQLQKEKKGLTAKELLEIPHKIENYNQAVDMITERGARSQAQAKAIQECMKMANGEDLTKKLNFL